MSKETPVSPDFSMDKYKKKTVRYALVQIIIERDVRGWFPVVDTLEYDIESRKDADDSRMGFLVKNPGTNPQNLQLLQYDSVE